MNNLSVLLLVTTVAVVPLSAAAEDALVARINGVEIKQSDLDFAASELGGRLANYAPEEREKVLVSYVIDIQLLAGAALKEELDKKEGFADRVKYHTRRALANAYFDADIRDKVSEESIKKTYREDYKPQQQIHVRHILVDTEAEANDIAERLKKGEDFNALAKEKSKDKTEGGDLGFISRGQTVKPFEDAVFGTVEGEISEPVKTQFGWHIIKVEEIREQPAPLFEQVKEPIVAQLADQKAKEVVAGLRKEATIEFVDPEIKKAMADDADGEPESDAHP